MATSDNAGSNVLQPFEKAGALVPVAGGEMRPNKGTNPSGGMEKGPGVPLDKLPSEIGDLIRKV